MAHSATPQRPYGADREPLAATPADTGLLSRRYVGPPGRQLHLLEGGAGRPFWCFHATAYSGRSFTPFLEAMAARRRVAAVDAPGYGASDPPPAQMPIEGYAEAIGAALDAAEAGSVDLFGYHTGALVAAELARQRPDKVSRLILIGVPFFVGPERETWRARLAERMSLSEDFEQFRPKWDYFITRRAPGVSLSRGFDNFVDELRAYPHGWWAHEAAFTFDVAACFAAVRQPTLVINPHNHLAEASRRAAGAVANSRVIEMPHLENGIFDVAAEELAAIMDAFR